MRHNQRIFRMGAMLILCMACCIGACNKSCSASYQPSASDARIHAGDWAAWHAQQTVFIAQEVALLHPNSQRAKASRKAQLVVDEIVTQMPDDDEE